MFKSREHKLLDAEIERVIRSLKNWPVHSDSYEKSMRHLSELRLLKEEDKSKTVSKDTLAVVLANLTGIVLVINHEHVHVITSKAIQMLIPPKIKS